MNKLKKSSILCLVCLSISVLLTGCHKNENMVENVSTDYDKQIKEEMDKSNISLINFYHTSADKIVLKDENKKDKDVTTLILNVESNSNWLNDLYIPTIKINNSNQEVTNYYGYNINDNNNIIFLVLDDKIDINSDFDVSLSIDNENGDGTISLNKTISSEKKEVINLSNNLDSVGKIGKISEDGYILKLNSALNTDIKEKDNKGTKVLEFFTWGTDNNFDSNNFKILDENDQDITKEINVSFDIQKIYDYFCSFYENNEKGLFGKIQITTNFNIKDFSDEELNNFISKINKCSIKINDIKIPFKDIKQDYR